MKNREVLEELYHSYVKQRKDALSRINTNENVIGEIDKFLVSCDDKNEDLSVFSPYDVNYLYDGKVEKEKNRKKNLLNETNTLYELVDELNKRISQFKEILDESKDEKELSLNDYMVDIQEKERQRIASELHDTTVQNLVHIIHSIELSSMFIDQDPLRAKLEMDSCVNNLRSTIDGIRETIFNLRPMSFDDLGFEKCIEDFISNMMIQYNNVQFEYYIDNIISTESVCISLYRIIQEAVTNSLKHSKSDDIYINVKDLGDSCDICIKDSGIGFDYNDMKSNHFGLAILEERVNLLNGSINIDSVKDEGTTISVSIPL